jgi:hypothetical protein
MIWERRADMVSIVGVAFVVGWLSCGGYYSITKLWAVEDRFVAVETREVPALKTQVRQANCDKNRLVDLAAQGIVASQTDAVAAPKWEDLHGCPTQPAVKAPEMTKILPK